MSRKALFDRVERCAIALRFDDEIPADETPEVSERQKESGEFEIRREEKFVEMKGVNARAKALAANEGVTTIQGARGFSAVEGTTGECQVRKIREDIEEGKGREVIGVHVYRAN